MSEIDVAELERLAKKFDVGTIYCLADSVYYGDGDLMATCSGNIGHMPEPVSEDEAAYFIEQALDAVPHFIAKIRALEAERDALRKDRERYQWLANRVLGCDYGDNDAPGAQIGWRICHDLLAHNGRQPAFMYGASIDAAIDAAIAAKEPR